MARFYLAVCMALLVSATTAIADAQKVDVKKTATCGCCQAWIDHLRQSGFQVTAQNMAMGELMKFKLAHGVSPDLSSCHTGRVGGYTIEGHVPAREIARLLKERPDAVGLTVPGMPIGSPGMEAGSQRDAYQVLLIKRDGKTEVFATYPEQR